MNHPATIAAIASPPGTGAVSLIRMSGPEAARIASERFQGKSKAQWRPRTQYFGKIVSGAGEAIDEVLLTFFSGPHSFTGEDTIEVACHGGVVVTKRVLDEFLSAGAEPADPGEFSQRAFLNGKMDLTQAEAVMDLISARTDLAAKAAQEQLSGRLGDELEAIRQQIIGLLAHLEAYIDFPDEDIDPDSADQLTARLESIREQVQRLLATADQGRLLREGVRTVICGAPNAGKSSLLNLLLGFDRAIVTDQAGTTRDTIEEIINLNGIPVRLIDTAGIREGAEEIEQAGIARSKQQLSRAELILWVIDSSAPAQEGEWEFPEGRKVVQIFNKSDLSLHDDWKDGVGLHVSCLESRSIDLVREHLYKTLTEAGGIDTSNLTAINARHQHCLKQAARHFDKAAQNLELQESPEFVAMDLREALASIGEVIGKTDIEEILGEIFSSFCIGK